MRILIVEDEPAIADFVERGLRAEGHAVEVAYDGPEGERRALESEIDLVVLDRMLPGKDGLAVLRAIREAKPAMPVIVLTAPRRGRRPRRGPGRRRDRLPRQAVRRSRSSRARVRAHLRTPCSPRATELSAAGISMDLLSREVTRDGAPVHLSAKEFDLLAHFLRHPNQVLSREQLLSAVWGYDFDPQTNIVEVYVGYLRRKLSRAGPPGPDRHAALRGLPADGPVR